VLSAAFLLSFVTGAGAETTVFGMVASIAMAGS
jgi:hypothetical protein